MNEDEGTRYISLSTYFEDSDGDTLAYSILSLATWASTYSTDLATYTIQSSNATLKIELAKNHYGEENITLNVTDGKKWIAQPLTLALNVTEVNDPPILSKLGGKNVLGKTMSLSATEDVQHHGRRVGRH